MALHRNHAFRAGSWTIILVLHALLAAIAAGGCRALPVYRLDASYPHKDAVLITVHVDGREDLEIYRGIVLAELRRLEREGTPDGVPLYEVRFEFQRRGFPGERLAAIIVRMDGSDPPSSPENPGPPTDPREWETYLY